MADTTLRAYVKELDELVEREQLDEAIAHCRHILEKYPKHVDSYRVLGKAYLEAKRFGDAADIFQRVLSAVPDDFVAQIGMAIVREDEGNLDAAIWHIERAFETNPANPAIQQELRRLIGRRDGIEPHKVRMTRGALARMYAHGELYQQAIAELISALQDDQDRPDLEVLLATMYWKTDQHAEAAEVCSRIIEKLPYCREANRIMASILQDTGKTEDASAYHRRLAALDPYMAYVESAKVDPQTIDASSIRIDKYGWQPGEPMPAAELGQPEWATSLGVELAGEAVEEEEVSDRPAWLEELEGPVPAGEPFPTEEDAEPEPMIEAEPEFMIEAEPEPMIEAEPTPESDIPDWMREAGWSEATGEVAEESVVFSDDELTAIEEGVVSEEGDLAPADIPGWLQDIAPEKVEGEPIETPEPSVIPEGEDLSGWLQEMDAEVAEPEEIAETVLSPDLELEAEELFAELAEEDEISEPLEEIHEPVEAEETPGLPAWLESETPGATTTIVTWLGERKDSEAVAPEPTDEVEEIEAVEEITPEPEEAVPDWLDQEDLEPSEAEPVAEEPPSWLEGVAEIAAQQEEEPILDVEPPSEEPVELAPDEDVPEWLHAISEPSEEEPAVEPIAEDAPDWLDGIAEPEAELPEPGPLPREEVPDWLRGIAEPESVEPSPEDEPTPIAEEGAEWLAGIAEPTDEAAPTPEAPEWLEEFATAADVEVETEAELDTFPEVAEVEEVAPESIEPTPVSEAETIIAGLDREEPAEVVSGEELDDDEVLGWLEGLAARQGEEEEPDLELEAAISPPVEVVPESFDEQAEIPEEPEESLEWLERLATERGIDVDVTSPPGDEPIEEEKVEAPAWLESMATEPIPHGLPPELTPEIPDWLRGEEEAPAAEAEPAAPPAEAELEPEAVVPEPPAPPPPAPEIEPEPEVVEPLVEVEPEPLTPEPASVETVVVPPPEPVDIEQIEPVEPPAPPAEPEPVVPAAQVEPEPAEPIPVEYYSELEPEDVEPEAEVVQPEVPPPSEPVPVDFGEAVPIEPEGEDDILPGKVVPIEPIAAEVPETPAPLGIEPVSEVEPEAEQPPEPIPVEPVEPEAPIPVEPVAAEQVEPVATEVPTPTESVEVVPVDPAVAEPPVPAEPVAAEAPAPLEPVEEVTPPLVEPTPSEPVEAVPAEPAPEIEATVIVDVPQVPAAPEEPKKPEVDPKELVKAARQALASGDTDQAVTAYKSLIKTKTDLKTVIEDLRTALERDPKQPSLWQVLGDAYMGDDQLSEAIDAYQRGMEVA
jgi:tetratricopeptide (TPR) repeat protein